MSNTTHIIKSDVENAWIKALVNKMNYFQKLNIKCFINGR